jgi:putative spermidine/putrescine transport system permease protein
METVSSPALSAPGRTSAKPRRTRERNFGLLVYLGPLSLFYLLFLVAPYLILLRMSFNRFSSIRLYIPDFTLVNYFAVVTDPFYLLLIGRTIGLGLIVTIVTLILGYPLALKIVRSPPRMKSILLAITLSPLLINIVVRTYAWLVLLGDKGLINHWLMVSGIVSSPLPINGTVLSVTIGLVHITLPFMVLSLMSVIQRIDQSLPEAAQSLGASSFHVMRRIILPLSLPGIGAGSLFVFCFTVSAFITPALLGGNRVETISTFIYQKFTFSVNWPMGATLVFFLLAINLIVVALHGRLFREHQA